MRVCVTKIGGSNDSKAIIRTFFSTCFRCLVSASAVCLFRISKRNEGATSNNPGGPWRFEFDEKC
jgi:hypothetical protein